MSVMSWASLERRLADSGIAVQTGVSAIDGKISMSIIVDVPGGQMLVTDTFGNGYWTGWQVEASRSDGRIVGAWAALDRYDDVVAAVQAGIDLLAPHTVMA